MKYTAIVDGKNLEIELTGTETQTIHALVDGHKYALDVHQVEPGVFWIVWNNRSLEISVSPNSEGYSVAADGQHSRIEIVDARDLLRKASHQGHAGAVELRAPMPGKIVKVLAQEGAEVDINQGLLVIEAMKMQNEVKSPKKGVVRKIGVKEAAAVNAGDMLIIVE
jgi:biotin carboxyl carrier protein